MKYYTLTFSASDGGYFLNSWGYKLTRQERKKGTVTPYYRSDVNVTPGFSVDTSGLSGLRSPAYNAAFTQFQRKVDDHSLMLANLVELPGTISAIGKAAESVGLACKEFAFGITALKRSPKQAAWRFKRGRKALGVSNLKEFNDTAAGAVLAVNWALRPVTDDVTKALTQHEGTLLSWRKVRAAGGRATLKHERNGTVTQIRKLSVRYRLGAEIRVSNPTLRKLRDTGLTDPLGTAWELTPFSFVIDWFVNVGDHITALGLYSGLEVRNGFSSRLEEVNHSYYDSYWKKSLDGTSTEKYRDVGHPTSPKWEFTPPVGGLVRTLNQVAFCVTQMRSLRAAIYNL